MALTAIRVDGAYSHDHNSMEPVSSPMAGDQDTRKESSLKRELSITNEGIEPAKRVKLSKESRIEKTGTARSKDKGASNSKARSKANNSASSDSSHHSSNESNEKETSKPSSISRQGNGNNSASPKVKIVFHSKQNQSIESGDTIGDSITDTKYSTPKSRNMTKVGSNKRLNASSVRKRAKFKTPKGQDAKSKPNKLKRSKKSQRPKSPPIAVVEPPDFNPIITDLGEEHLQCRLLIREYVLRFERHCRLPLKHINIINDVTGTWGDVTFKALTANILRIIYSDNFPVVPTQILKNAIKEVEKTASDNEKIWWIVQDVLKTQTLTSSDDGQQDSSQQTNNTHAQLESEVESKKSDKSQSNEVDEGEIDEIKGPEAQQNDQRVNISDRVKSEEGSVINFATQSDDMNGSSKLQRKPATESNLLTIQMPASLNDSRELGLQSDTPPEVIDTDGDEASNAYLSSPPSFTPVTQSTVATPVRVESVFKTDNVELEKLSYIKELIFLSLAGNYMRETIEIESDTLRKKMTQLSEEMKSLNESNNMELENMKLQYLEIPPERRDAWSDRYEAIQLRCQREIRNIKDDMFRRRRKMASRNIPLGMDAFGNIYWLFAERGKSQIGWGSWIMCHKASNLPSPTGRFILPKSNKKTEIKTRHYESSTKPIVGDSSQEDRADAESTTSDLSDNLIGDNMNWYAIEHKEEAHQLTKWIRYVSTVIFKQEQRKSRKFENARARDEREAIKESENDSVDSDSSSESDEVSESEEEFLYYDNFLEDLYSHDSRRTYLRPYKETPVVSKEAIDSLIKELDYIAEYLPSKEIVEKKTKNI
ncbi:hypothetical protein V1511DRAFT_502870 [Dipodascopsis uninucleata]